jgi:DNA-directed RNA polymerase specialized sigma24 family protein
MAKWDDDDVRRARRGDPEAFARVVTRFWPQAWRISWNLLGNTVDASAVTETAVTLALRFPDFSDGPFRSVLLGMVIDLALVRCRSQRAPNPPQRGANIRELLAHVDALDRAAFVLREVEALPADEVALILRTSAREVRARVHRATLRLVELLRFRLHEGNVRGAAVA